MVQRIALLVKFIPVNFFSASVILEMFSLLRVAAILYVVFEKCL